MSQFNPDPNKPGWGTYVNDAGQAAYDYFPNLAPKTQPLNPSATPANQSTAPNMSQAPAPEPLQSVQPPVDAAAPVQMPAGVDPHVGKLLGAMNSLVPAGMSTTTASGRSQAGVNRDKAAAAATLKSGTTLNTEVGAARRERAETVARGQQGAAMSDALNNAGQLSTDLQAQAANTKKLSDTLAEKDPSVDPGRLIRNLSTGASLATIVLAALSGGFASVAGKKSNAALDAINKAINDDIASQEREIESGRIRRGNLVQAYREQGMDLKQSIAAARATITDATRRYGEAQAAELGSAVFTEDAQLVNQGLQSQYDQQVSALDASGEARTQTTKTFAPAAKGDAGESVKKALELDALLEKQGYSKEQRQKALGAVGLQPPEGQSAAEQAASKPSVEKEKRESQLSTLDNLATQLDALPEDTHSRSSEFVGKRAVKGAADFVFGEGAGDVAMSDQEKADRQVFEQAVNNYASLQSQALGQGALAGPEFDRAKAAAYAMGPRELARAIRSFSTSVGGKGAASDIQVEDR